MPGAERPELVLLRSWADGRKVTLATTTVDPAVIAGPTLRLQLLRRGAFFLLFANRDFRSPGALPLSYVESPSSNLDCQHHVVEPTSEPLAAFTGVVASGVAVLSQRVLPYQWEVSPMPSRPASTANESTLSCTRAPDLSVEPPLPFPLS